MTDDVLEKLSILIAQKWHELEKIGDGSGFFGGLDFQEFEKELAKVEAKKHRYFKNLGCKFSTDKSGLGDTENCVVIKWVTHRIPSSGVPLRYMFFKVPVDLAEKILVLGCLP